MPGVTTGAGTRRGISIAMGGMIPGIMVPTSGIPGITVIRVGMAQAFPVGHGGITIGDILTITPSIM